MVTLSCLRDCSLGWRHHFVPASHTHTRCVPTRAGGEPVANGPLIGPLRWMHKENGPFCLFASDLGLSGQLGALLIMWLRQSATFDVCIALCRHYQNRTRHHSPCLSGPSSRQRNENQFSSFFCCYKMFIAKPIVFTLLCSCQEVAL